MVNRNLLVVWRLTPRCEVTYSVKSQVSFDIVLWIDSGRPVAVVSVCPRYNSARTDLVMHVNTPSSPRAFKVIVLTQACRVFVCFPAHWLMMERSFLLARFLFTWPTESGWGCLPRAVPPDASQNERCTVCCWCFPRPNQTFFQTFEIPVTRIWSW